MSPFRLRTADDSSGDQKRLSFDHVALRPRQFQRTDLRSRQWSSNGPNGPSGPWMSRENMLTPGIPWDLRKVGGACNTIEHVRVPDCTCLEAITYLLQDAPSISKDKYMIRLTTALALAPCQVRAGTCLQRSWTIRAPVLTSPSPLRFAPSQVAVGHRVTWCWNLVTYVTSGHR